MICLFWISTNQVFAQNIDSLSEIVSESVGKVKIESCISSAIYYFNKKPMPDSCMYFMELAYEEAKSSQIPDSLKANVLAKYAVIHININLANSDETLIKEILEELTELGDEKRLSDAYNSYGIYFFVRSEYENALIYYQKSLDIEIELGSSPAAVAISNSNIGDLLSMMDRVGESIERAHESIRLLKGTIHEVPTLYQVYINLAKYYCEKSADLTFFQPDSAVHYAKLGLAGLREINYDYGVAIAQHQLSSAILLQKNPSREQLNEALEMSIASVSFFKNSRDQNSYFQSLTSEAKARIALGEIQTPIEIGKELISEKSTKKREGYDVLVKAYSNKGDFRTSLKYYQLMTAIDDSLYKMQKTRKLEELQTKYETEKKEAEIQNLTQASSIKTLELHKQRQWILIGGVSMLLLFASGLAFYFHSQKERVKTRTEKMEIEQRFLRSQLNPHFIFNAIGSIQSFMLQKDPIQANEYMTKFAGLMRQILAHSRQNYITLAEETKMLKNYLDLQQLYSEKEFSYTLELGEGMDEDEIMIPPMFVQPFIENAIEHGLQKEKGDIKVHFEMVENTISITISDNGIGISTSKQQRQATNPIYESLATSIINERIRNFNRGKIGNISLKINDILQAGKAKGTQVSIQLPFQLNSTIG